MFHNYLNEFPANRHLVSFRPLPIPAMLAHFCGTVFEHTWMNIMTRVDLLDQRDYAFKPCSHCQIAFRRGCIYLYFYQWNVRDLLRVV